MSVLLDDTEYASAEEDIRERLEEFVGKLSHDVPNEPNAADLRPRREACRDLREFVSENPAAARHLTPILVEIFREEIERTFGSAADDMLIGNVSRSIKVDVSQLLARLVDLDLIQAYERSNSSFDALVECLSNAIDESRNTSVRYACIRGLGKICQWEPDRLVESIPDAEVERVASAAGKSLVEIDDDDHCRHTVRLLAVLSAHTPDKVPSDDTIRRGVYFTSVREDMRCRAFAGYVCDALSFPARPTSLPTEPGSTTVVQLTRRAAHDDFSDRQEVSRSIGALLALHSKIGGSGLQSLRHRVQSTDGVGQQIARGALGEMFVGTERFEDGPPESLVQQVRSSSDERARTAREYLGEIAATVPKRFDDPPEELVDRVNDSAGAYRFLASEVLGEVVVVDPEGMESAPDEWLDRLDVLADLFKESPREVVGEIATISAASGNRTFEPQIERILDATPKDRRWSSRVLGETICTIPSGSTGIPEVLVGKAKEASSPEQDWVVKQAIGETVLANEGDIEEIPVDLADFVHSLSGEDRRWATFVVGSAVISAVSNCSLDLVHALLKTKREVPPMGHQIVNSVIGTLIRSRPDRFDEIPRELIDGTDTSEGHLTAESIGALATTVSPSGPSLGDALKTWIREAREEELIRACTILGKVVSDRPTTVESVPQRLIDAASEAPDHQKRYRFAAVGAVTAAPNIANDARAFIEKLHSERADAADWPPVIVGAVVVSDPEARTYASRSLLEHGSYVDDDEVMLELEAVGEVEKLGGEYEAVQFLSRKLRAPIDTGDRIERDVLVFHTIVQEGNIDDIEEFLETISIEKPGGDTTGFYIRPYLDHSEGLWELILRSTDTVASRDDRAIQIEFVQQQVREFLSNGEVQVPKTRVTAVSVLSKCDVAASVFG